MAELATRLLGWLRREPGPALLMLGIVGAAVLYAPALGYGLSGYDDPWLYASNYVVQRPSLESLRTIFFDLDVSSPGRWALTPEYLPIRDLSVMLDYAIWGAWYPGLHATSLLLYLAAIAMAYALLTSFGVARTTAGIAALLWALHPTHAESVAWLAERKGVLSTLLALAAGVAYARFRAGGSPRWLVAAALAAVAAVWSKAPAASAIAALAALELALPARRASPRRAVVGLGAIAVASGLAFAPVLALATSADVVGGASAIPAGRLAAVLGVHGHYLQAGALAVPASIAYPIASAGPTAAQLALGAAGLAALAAALIWGGPAVRAAAVIWLAGWLPVSHLVLPLQMVAVADRYALFMTLGLALAAALAAGRIRSPRVRATAIAAVAVLAAARTYDARSLWASPIRLWERAAESDPRSGLAWSMYAEALASAGRADLAREAVATGLVWAPTPRLRLRDALLRLEAGDRAGGLAAMRQAAEAGEPRAMANLAVAELEAGRRDAARSWARRGAAAAPRLAHTRRVAGRVALETGQLAEAHAELSAALRLERSAANLVNLATVLVALDRPAAALPYLAEVAGAPGAEPALRARARAVHAEATRRLQRGPTPGPGPAVR